MEEIDKLVKDINKKFGINAIRRGSKIKEEMSFKIPLGSVGLTSALNGGLPSGRYITLAGQESSGKSLLAYKAIATVQQMRKKLVKDGDFEYEVVAEDGDIPLKAALIELECGSFDTLWGEVNGIDCEELLFCQPEGMEQALDIAYALQQAGVEFIVIDSIAAMLPTKEIETDLQDTVQMGLRAKCLQSYYGKFQAYNNTLERQGKLPCTVLAINQFREKIGVMYGDTTTVPGGKAQVYTNAVEIRLRVGDYIKEGTGSSAKIVGRVVKWKLQKNKVGTAFQDGEYDMYIDDAYLPRGSIDTSKELVVLAVVKGVIERRGAWYFFNGEQLAQGQDNLIDRIRNDEKLFSEIVGRI